MTQGLLWLPNDSATWNSSQEREYGFRKCIRDCGPSKGGGLNVQDLDLYLSTYRSVDNRVLLAEVKSCEDGCDHTTRRNPKPISGWPQNQYGQQRMAEDFDYSLRLGIPSRYLGFYIVSLEHEHPHESEWVYINGYACSLYDWHRLVLNLDMIVPPLILKPPPDLQRVF